MMAKLADKMQWFYDTEITFIKREYKQQDDGGFDEPTDTEMLTVECNPQPTTNRMVKETFGVDFNADLIITMRQGEPVKKGYIFSHNAINYEVEQTLQHDASTVVLAKVLNDD